jgi:tetratricopeptide (TPR) repeat protein
VNRIFSKPLTRFLTAAAAAALLVASPPAWSIARADVTTLILRDPGRSEATDPEQALALARRRLAAHDTAAAVDGLERYLSVYPQELVVQRFLGDLYFRLGNFSRAESTYRGIVERYPYDSQTHHRLGMLDVLETRTDPAIAEFEASLPESIDDLVMAHQRKGDLDGFERDLEARAKARPGDADAQYEMAETYDDLRLPRDAVTFFQRALRIYPKSTDFLNGLAVAQMQIGDRAGAEETFGRCLGVDSNNYACTNDRGSLYLDEKRYDDAERELTRAHVLAPEAPEALVNLGYLADERGDRERGAEYYTAAIYAWPYSADAYVDLSFDRVRQGLMDQAESVLLKGLAIAPDDPRIHYLLGIVDEVHGKRAEAVAEFRSAERSSDPNIVNSARANVADIENSPASAGGRPTPPPPSPHR